jgi:hypothetical protein
MSKPVVAYYRVSAREQGKSGLGIDAQRAAVARFAEAEGFDLVAEFTDVETGKGADALDRRPQLAAAWVEARRNDNARYGCKVDPPIPGCGTSPEPCGPGGRGTAR